MSEKMVSSQEQTVAENHPASQRSVADPPYKNVQYLPTHEAYNRWAGVYDTDGNFLQGIDDWEMREWLFPRFLGATGGSGQDGSEGKGMKVLDLGCGTGRNTALLIDADGIKEVVAVDVSSGMLEVAKGRLVPEGGIITGEGGEGNEIGQEKGTMAEVNGKKIIFGLYDVIAAANATGTISAPTQATTTVTTPAQCPPGTADGIISTLVIEHTPLKDFFACASTMLKSGGVLLLTNMHSHMGSISQAGFVDTETGQKIRPTSYAHTVEDVVSEARRWGLIVIGDKGVEGGWGVKEVGVTEDMVVRLGPRSRKWVGVTCWFGGLFRKEV